MRILVTGGAGYIGSHTCLELLRAGHEVSVVDNLSNSSPIALERVRQLAGKPVSFFEADLRDRAALDHAVTDAAPEAVIHFAGLKAVGESCEFPLRYYDNNVGGTVILCEVMAAHGVRNIVFSSSATVYGNPERVPLTEDSPLQTVNPYGRSKLMVEEILRDVAATGQGWRIVLLRYFNPVGAHPSGRIGEDPKGIPNNLFPYVTQVAVGRLPELRIFGDDYPTQDGTGVRDYIHVVDLAEGHLSALRRLEGEPGVSAYNLGTGRGYSVLEVVSAFERVSGVPIPRRIVPRRPGDAAVCYADPGKTRIELGWSATRGLEEMCAVAWRWQRENPDGYQE